MFKKNPNRPPMVVSLKKVQGGYKVAPNEGHSLFQVKRIIRTMYRPDLNPQAPGLRLEQNGLSIPSTIIQPPSHFTLPAFANWFSPDKIHPIEQESFPELFQPQRQALPFSFKNRNAKLYKYYRNTMVGMWLQNVKKHLSAAHCRRVLAGDVSLIVRIHGFLQNWGLINFPSREHSKGLQVTPSEKLTCYVCEEQHARSYWVTRVEELLFQLCPHCYHKNLYPREIDPSDFVEVQHSNYQQPRQKTLSPPQLIRLLECLQAGKDKDPQAGKDKEKDVWTLAQKEFPQLTKQDLLFNFLRVPLASPMNANIFDSHEDLLSDPEPEESPTVFEDYQNPLQAALAVCYKQFKESDPKEGKDLRGRIGAILEAGERHAEGLGGEQEVKIQELTKMLVDVSFSKLELKSIFIQEYERLVEKCLSSQRGSVANCLAEGLKQNIRFLENNCRPEELQPQSD